MTSIKGKAAIVGIAEMEERRAPGKTVLQIHMEMAKQALEDAGLKKEDVDGFFTAGTHGLGLMPTITLAEYLQIRPTFIDSTNIGGSSFVSHVGHAAAAIAAGLCRVALITYGSDSWSQMEAIGTGGAEWEEATQQFEVPYGVTTVGAYALAAQRHMYQYGTTSEQLAEIAVATRKWASLNPQAMFRDPITIQDVLSSRMVSTPLHKLDCCVISDGGGALVMTSAERARDLRQPRVYVLGVGEAVTHLAMSQMPDLTSIPAQASGEKAFRMAGVKREDIDVVCAYDSFTITALLTLEGLGFCPKGEGGAFVSGQRTAPGGPFPVNPDGGGLSSNHPGMRGIFLVIEATRQLRGGLGKRQVPGARLALAHGTGGYLSSGATAILGKETS